MKKKGGKSWLCYLKSRKKCLDISRGEREVKLGVSMEVKRKAGETEEEHPSLA